MRKILLLAFSALTLCACHHNTLEDQAQKTADDYTERYCPTPEQDMTITDSIAFDRNTLTFSYYLTVTGKADDSTAIARVKGELTKTLLDKLKENTSMKVFKDAGYNFRYVYRSQKTKKVLYEKVFTKKEY